MDDKFFKVNKCFLLGKTVGIPLPFILYFIEKTGLLNGQLTTASFEIIKNLL